MGEARRRDPELKTLEAGMVRSGWAMRGVGLALLGVALSPVALRAGELSGTARIRTNQLGAFTRTQPRGALDEATVFFRGDAVRIEFSDAAGRHRALVLPADRATGWLEDARGNVLPLPMGRWPLRADPAQPCAGQGMFADCQPAGDGLYAGRNARQWRYRLPNATGPGRTRQGWMWLDADTGFVLAYEGDTGVGADARWEVRSVQYGPLPDALFKPPAAAGQSAR